MRVVDEPHGPAISNTMSARKGVRPLECDDGDVCSTMAAGASEPTTSGASAGKDSAGGAAAGLIAAASPVPSTLRL